MPYALPVVFAYVLLLLLCTFKGNVVINPAAFICSEIIFFFISMTHTVWIFLLWTCSKAQNTLTYLFPYSHDATSLVLHPALKRHVIPFVCMPLCEMDGHLWFLFLSQHWKTKIQDYTKETNDKLGASEVWFSCQKEQQHTGRVYM